MHCLGAYKQPNASDVEEVAGNEYWQHRERFNSPYCIATLGNIQSSTALQESAANGVASEFGVQKLLAKAITIFWGIFEWLFEMFISPTTKAGELSGKLRL